MATPDPTLTSAAATAREFSAGVSRTLARGQSTGAKPPGMPTLFEVSGEVARPGTSAQGPSTQPPHGLPPTQPMDQSAPDPLSSHQDGYSANQPRRSPTQMAALLARMIAQGQRNL
jgi:hypothetical protein